MRRAANVDKNQAAVKAALQAIGCTVQDISGAGKGMPDLLVGSCGINLLIEVKNPERKGGRENAQGTLKRQSEWRQSWKGAVYVVETPAEAVADVKRAIIGIEPACPRNSAELGARAMTHFGDPCVHCGVPHDDVPPGPCMGDPGKAVDIAFCSLGVRHDNVERFVVKRSDGSLREHFEHISMGFGDDALTVYGRKLRYDERLKDEAVSAGIRRR